MPPGTEALAPWGDVRHADPRSPRTPVAEPAGRRPTSSPGRKARDIEGARASPRRLEPSSSSSMGSGSEASPEGPISISISMISSNSTANSIISSIIVIIIIITTIIVMCLYHY